MVNTIESIEIPKQVTTLDNACFNNCTNLKYVTFESGSQLTTINSNVFKDSDLKSIIIPEGCTTIGSEVFRGCYSNLLVDIPSTVTSIGSLCFFL